MAALPEKKHLAAGCFWGRETAQDLLSCLNLKFPSVRQNILSFLNRPGSSLSSSPPAPQNCSVSHRFALFVVKDPLIPAEGCPWAFYLHLFNCQPQVTVPPVSPSVPLSAPCSGSSSIPSLCTPPLAKPLQVPKEGSSPHHCPTCAGFSQSLLSVVGSGLQTQLLSKGSISPDTFCSGICLFQSHIASEIYERQVHPCLPLLCFQCLSSRLGAEAPFTGDPPQLLFLKVTQFLPQEK